MGSVLPRPVSAQLSASEGVTEGPRRGLPRRVSEREEALWAGRVSLRASRPDRACEGVTEGWVGTGPSVLGLGGRSPRSGNRTCGWEPSRQRWEGRALSLRQQGRVRPPAAEGALAPCPSGPTERQRGRHRGPGVQRAEPSGPGGAGRSRRGRPAAGAGVHGGGAPWSGEPRRV